MLFLTIFIATVTDIEIASDSISVGNDITIHTLMGAFVQSGVTISVSVEATVTDGNCDTVMNNVTIEGGEFSHHPHFYCEWSEFSSGASVPKVLI